MTNIWSRKFGALINEYREANNLPLRKVAAELDIDQSVLSKIERGERSADIRMVSTIAEMFSLDLKGLQVDVLSDKILEENGDFSFLKEALKESLKKLSETNR